MPLGTDARFGPDVIGAATGAGGIGEVYQARDTRLDRGALAFGAALTLAVDEALPIAKQIVETFETAHRRT